MTRDPDNTRGHRRPDEAVPPVPEVEAPDSTHDLHAVETPEEHEALTRPAWLPVRLVEWAGGAVALALMFGVTYGVIVRAAGRGVTGLLELAGVAVLVLTLLGAPSLTYRDENVRLEIVDMFASSAVLKVLNIISDLIQLAVVLVIVYGAVLLFQRDLERGTTMGGELGLGRFWLTGMIALGFAVVAAATIRKLWHDLRGVPDRGRER
ncbi:TRAP-type C4-dicarboxylate transport system, small permease component [Raineyella antarctica]|uniref:TRAP-type C4-dicarboxylate transport system, small permease component n=1 Tax=Raineyella antarctica TaxID=1577474 RepID=A0A1G6GJ99_9ACTN|nr:TRAP transporter small permease [Raineyella antarctica]SDB81913.1 TRAP-type C4-dicarboxylate transport system, small permease component [Raineyella antarctica]